MAPMVAIPMVATVAMGLLSAQAQYQSGRAQQRAYEQRARIDEADAQAARERGILEEGQSRERTKRLLGEQRALYGKAGVALSSGSPLLVLAETAAEGEEEAMAIRAGTNAAYTRGMSQAGLNRFYGRSAYSAGKVGAATTFLNSLAQAGTSYAQYSSGYGGMAIKNPYTGRKGY